MDVNDLTPEQLEMLAVKKRKERKEENEKRLAEIDEELADVEERQDNLREALMEVEQEKLALENEKMKLEGGGGLWRDLGEDSPSTILTEILLEAKEPLTMKEIRERAIPVMEERGSGGKNPEASLNTTLSSSNRFYRVERGVYALADWVRSHLELLNELDEE